MDSSLDNGVDYHRISGLWHPTPVPGAFCNQDSSSVVAPSWRNEITGLFKERKARKLIFLLILSTACYCVLLVWSSNTRSMALLAYTFTIGFNLLSLLICILSLWVEHQPPTPLFTFGYDRYEVLAVFGSTVLAQLSSLFIIKESIERLVLEQPEVRIGLLLLGGGIAFMNHLVVLYGCSHTALDHVAAASSSSWLQEHVSDVSQSLCSVLPALSGLLLPRVNPMLLIACSGVFSLVLVDILIEFKGCHVVDTLAGMWVALTMWATMLPMSMYSGKVLMQTTPAHLVGQLDKCLRETLTIDGVLEFCNEHFWTLSFGKMAGSLQVRVRRDANEQMVLAHVVDRLSSVVSELTVQVFKDDWALRRGVGNIGGGVGIQTSSFPPILGDIAFGGNNHVTSKAGYRLFSSSVTPTNSFGSTHPSPSSVSSLPNYDITGTRISDCHVSLPYVKSDSGNRGAFTTYSLNGESSVSQFNQLKFSTFDASYLQQCSNLPGSKETEHSLSLKEQSNHTQPFIFIPNVNIPNKSSLHQLQEGNLLMSGVSSFDADNLTYRPR